MTTKDEQEAELRASALRVARELGEGERRAYARSATLRRHRCPALPDICFACVCLDIVTGRAGTPNEDFPQ
jgi:hypothetical protein